MRLPRRMLRNAESTSSSERAVERRTLIPRAAASWVTIVRKTGQKVLVRVYFPVCGMTKPIVLVFRAARPRAEALGWKSRDSMSFRTRRLVSSPTPDTPLITRDTVPLDTCAISAMSLIVTGFSGKRSR